MSKLKSTRKAGQHAHGQGAASLSRREALRRITLLAGGTLAAPAVSAVLSGCGSGDRTTYELRTLTQEQARALDAMVEVIIPATDTPGARQAGVTAFIDDALTDVLAPEDRDRFLAGLAEAQEMSDGAFQDLDADEQNRVMTTLMEEGRPLFPDGGTFFGSLRGLTIAGYYTSEIGATQEHITKMSFASYDGEYHLEANDGRAWAPHQW